MGIGATASVSVMRMALTGQPPSAKPGQPTNFESKAQLVDRLLSSAVQLDDKGRVLDVKA